MTNSSINSGSLDLHALSTPSFVTKVHHAPYAAIAPTQSSLSAAGKTILITGGATGIGNSIARNFAAAGASTIILLARRADTLTSASKELSSTYPKTQVLTYAASITDSNGINEVFKKAREAATSRSIDILVTSAAAAHTLGPTFSIPDSQIRDSFETNVMGNLNLVRAFLDASSSDSKPKILLDVSTNVTFQPTLSMSAYGATKSMFTYFLRHIRPEHSNLRVHSFHPGSVWTPLAQNAGIPKDAIKWDDADLPGQFAVWLASPQAKFTDGRMVLAHWDVEDLVKNKDIIEKDPKFGTMWLNV